MPQVRILNLMRRKFSSREANIVTAPANEWSLAGAVLYVREVMR